MVSLDKAVIARYQRGEDHFEILVDPHAAAELIDGKEVDILPNLAKEHMPLMNHFRRCLAQMILRLLPKRSF